MQKLTQNDLKTLEKINTHKLNPKESKKIAKPLEHKYREIADKYSEKYHSYTEDEWITKKDEIDTIFRYYITFMKLSVSMGKYGIYQRRSNKMSFELYDAIEEAKELGVFE